MLVAGGAGDDSTVVRATAELYDPQTHAWRMTGRMHVARSDQTATLLADGDVLVVGGYDAHGRQLRSAERYNPATGTWRLTGSMHYARTGFTTTLLPNGEVLAVGGADNHMASAERYDPHTGIWRLTSSMHYGRWQHQAIVLRTGTVLVLGGLGADSNDVRRTVEAYDPLTGRWGLTAPLSLPIADFSAMVLPNSTVLVLGIPSYESDFICATTARTRPSDACTPSYVQFYDPVRKHGYLGVSPRMWPGANTATTLNNGMVLIAGGWCGSMLNGTCSEDTLRNAALFDPRANRWLSAPAMHVARALFQATLLRNGQVLVTGGFASTAQSLNGPAVSSAELYVS